MGGAQLKLQLEVFMFECTPALLAALQPALQGLALRFQDLHITINALPRFVQTHIIFFAIISMPHNNHWSVRARGCST